MNILNVIKSLFKTKQDALALNKCQCGATPSIQVQAINPNNSELAAFPNEARIKCKTCGCCTEWRDSDRALLKSNRGAADVALVRQVVAEWNAGQFIIAEDITKAGDLLA